VAQNPVLKIGDLPTGWTGKPSTDTGDSATVEKEMAACIGTTAILSSTSNPTRVESDDFADPDETYTASNTVSLAPSTAAVNTAMDTFTNAKMPGCLAQAMDDAISQSLSSSATTLPAGTTVGKAQAASESFPNVADRTTAFRVTVPIRVNGVTANVSIDFIAFTKGRAGVTSPSRARGRRFPATRQPPWRTRPRADFPPRDAHGRRPRSLPDTGRHVDQRRETAMVRCRRTAPVNVRGMVCCG
jgi:hypothetical protein